MKLSQGIFWFYFEKKDENIIKYSVVHCGSDTNLLIHWQFIICVLVIYICLQLIHLCLSNTSIKLRSLTMKVNRERLLGGIAYI